MYMSPVYQQEFASICSCSLGFGVLVLRVRKERAVADQSFPVSQYRHGMSTHTQAAPARLFLAFYPILASPPSVHAALGGSHLVEHGGHRFSIVVPWSLDLCNRTLQGRYEVRHPPWQTRGQFPRRLSRSHREGAGKIQGVSEEGGRDQESYQTSP